MNRLPRHEQILKLVRANGFMPIEELARLLDVTPQTIRRDINTLSEENLLRRFHGGAADRGAGGPLSHLGVLEEPATN